MAGGKHQGRGMRKLIFLMLSIGLCIEAISSTCGAEVNVLNATGSDKEVEMCLEYNEKNLSLPFFKEDSSKRKN